jgi:exopolysaccharide biosynthesis operon protein EpsL
MTCHAARAQAGTDAPAPVLALHAQASVEHDSNILRAANAVSDQILGLNAGLRLDKRYGLQRVTLQAQAHHYQFRDSSNLDYSTFTYEGAWNLQMTPYLLGVFSADRRQFRDITNATTTGAIALRTERREGAEFTFLGRGGWRTLAGVRHNRSRSDDPRSLESSPTITSILIGGGYEFASGALLTGQVRRGDGDYGVGAAGVDFRETEPSVALRWPVSDKTTFDARVGHLDRSHDGAPARDFKGFVGTSALRWEYSPRTWLEAGFGRDLGSYEFNGGGSIRGWRGFIAPTWKPTEKTALRLRHAMERRDWRVVSSASPDLGREDRTRWTTLALEWTPRRFLALTATARHERRHTNLTGLDFRSNGLTLAARLNF